MLLPGPSAQYTSPHPYCYSPLPHCQEQRSSSVLVPGARPFLVGAPLGPPIFLSSAAPSTKAMHQSQSHRHCPGLHLAPSPTRAAIRVSPAAMAGWADGSCCKHLATSGPHVACAACNLLARQLGQKRDLDAGSLLAQCSSFHPPDGWRNQGIRWILRVLCTEDGYCTTVPLSD